MFSAARLTRPAVPPLARSYAAAANAASAKPPVQLFGLDGTYASALYTAASKASTLDSTDKTLSSLQALIQKDTKLASLMSSPTLDAGAKSALVSEVTKSVGGDKTIANLLAILAENNRLALVPGIVNQFATLMKAHRGEVEAVITSAQPLDQKILQRLEAAISKSQYIGQGKKLKVSNKVDQDILGGLVVEIGDRTIDLSVSSKMAKLNKLLTEAL